jgi:hypothetical protein
VESAHHAKSGHRVHAFLHCAWLRGSPTHDIDYDCPRVRAYTEEGNQVALENAIDQLDKARDVALMRSANYQQLLRRYHERNLRSREFHVGDLVLR